MYSCLSTIDIWGGILASSFKISWRGIRLFQVLSGPGQFLGFYLWPNPSLDKSLCGAKWGRETHRRTHLEALRPACLYSPEAERHV